MQKAAPIKGGRDDKAETSFTGLQKKAADKAADVKAEVKKALPAGVPTPGLPKAASKAVSKAAPAPSPVAAPAAAVEQAAKAVVAPVQQVRFERVLQESRCQPLTLKPSDFKFTRERSFSIDAGLLQSEIVPLQTPSAKT